MTITPERIAQMRRDILNEAFRLEPELLVKIHIKELSALLDLAESALAKPAPAEIDWSKLPKWAKWIAANPYGKAWAHECEPVCRSRVWGVSGGRVTPLDFTISGPWDQSLRVRP